MISNKINPDFWFLNFTYAGVSSKHLAPAPPHNRAFWRRGPRADLWNRHHHQGTGILIKEQASSSGNRHRHQRTGIVIREHASSSRNRQHHRGTRIVRRTSLFAGVEITPPPPPPMEMGRNRQKFLYLAPAF
jgi:hypothetical protein